MVTTYHYQNLTVDGIDDTGVNLSSGDGASEARIGLTFNQASDLRSSLAVTMDRWTQRRTRRPISEAIAARAMPEGEIVTYDAEALDADPAAQAREAAYAGLEVQRWIFNGNPDLCVMEIRDLRVFLPMIWLKDHWETWQDTAHPDLVFSFDTLARATVVLLRYCKEQGVPYRDDAIHS